MNPKISVIVPVYKVEKYLHKCIDSILAQTFTQFELILVNDGSPDRCGQICDDYAKKDKRIIVIHQENGGQSSARNAGINIAKGDYIGFVDSDDWISEDMYQCLYDLCEENNLDIAVCGLEFVYENSKQKKNSSNPASKYFQMDNTQGMYEMLAKGTFREEAWNKLYRKSLFNHIRYPLGRTHEDTLTTYKLFAVAQRSGYIDAEKYYYLQRSNSIMNSLLAKPSLDKIYALDEILKFIKEKYSPIYYDVLACLSLTSIDPFKALFNKDQYMENKKYIVELKKFLGKYYLDIIRNEKSSNGFKITVTSYIFSFRLTKLIMMGRFKA